MDFVLEVIRWLGDGSNWRGTNGIAHRSYEHLVLSALSVATAAAVAMPPAFALGHLRKGGVVAVNLANIGRALPSFAILVFAVQLVGIGAEPAYVAMVALAVPPIVTNTYVGVAAVGEEVRDAARGMGMSAAQQLLRVEAPLASPLVLAGVRTATVQVIATATLAALVGWGGLGRYIIDGLAQRDFVMLVAGAVLVAGLSVAADVALGWLERRVTPAGREVRDLGTDTTAVKTA